MSQKNSKAYSSKVLSMAVLASLSMQALQLPMAFAQVDTVIAGTRGGGFFKDGTYEILTPTNLHNKFVDKFTKISQEQLELYLMYEKEVRNEFQSLLRYAVYLPKKGLVSLSNESKVQKSVLAEDFMAATALYTEMKMQLEAKINDLKAVGKATEAVKLVIKKEETGSLPRVGNIEMSELIEFYNSKLLELDNMLVNLGYNININGMIHIIAPNSGKGLVLEHEYAMLSGDELAAMDQKIQDLIATGEVNAKEQAIRLNTHLRNMIRTFVTKYGTEEAYRLQGINESFKDERSKTLEEIQQIFFARSFLRAAYGLPVGSIGFDYTKKILKLDRLSSVEAFSKMINEMVWDETDLKKFRNNYSEMLSGLEQKTNGIFQGNYNLINNVNQAMTAIRGDLPTAQALEMIVIQLAMDLNEEIKVREFGGANKVVALYRARYIESNASKELSPDFAASREAILKARKGQLAVGSSSGFIGITNTLVSSLNTWTFNYSQANKLMAQKLNAMRASESAESSEVDERIENL